MDSGRRESLGTGLHYIEAKWRSYYYYCMDSGRRESLGTGLHYIVAVVNYYNYYNCDGYDTRLHVIGLPATIVVQRGGSGMYLQMLDCILSSGESPNFIHSVLVHL